MANFNLNKVILSGRLAADPELKTTPSGVHNTSFTVAVKRRYSSKNEGEAPTDFISCTAWRSTAEFITKYFRKGGSICVVGSIQTKTWTDKDGNKRYATEVVVDEAMFVDSKKEAGASIGESSATYTPYTESANTAPVFEDITDDDELPF